MRVTRILIEVSRRVLAQVLHRRVGISVWTADYSYGTLEGKRNPHRHVLDFALCNFIGSEIKTR